MRKYFEYASVLMIGAALYCIIELVWRGHTHWTMAVAGGVSFAVVYFLRKKCSDVSIILRCIAGAFTICAVEFTTGFIVNIILGWDVWDYSDRLFNLYGQICPLYAVYWFLICFPGNMLSDAINRSINRVFDFTTKSSSEKTERKLYTANESQENR